MAKTVLVTGASRGLGKGIALELSAAGFSVVIGYRGNKKAADRTTEECRTAAPEDSDARFLAVQADVSSPEDRSRILAQIESEFGSLDGLVNNAGMAPRVRADILDATEQSFEEVIRTNLQGPYFLTQAVAADWIRRGQTDGKVVFVTSISAETASPSRGEYCVSKAGLAMSAKLWAARLAGDGIGVFEVRPGIMQTDMTTGVKEKYDALIAEGLVPQKRWGTPADVGRVVRAIMDGSMDFSTGSVIHADGGFHLSRL